MVSAIISSFYRIELHCQLKSSIIIKYSWWNQERNGKLYWNYDEIFRPYFRDSNLGWMNYTSENIESVRDSQTVSLKSEYLNCWSNYCKGHSSSDFSMVFFRHLHLYWSIRVRSFSNKMIWHNAIEIVMRRLVLMSITIYFQPSKMKLSCVISPI